MQIKYKLVGISGKQLFSRFEEAIDEENTGWDGMDNARLTEDRATWITAWSGFSYTILNPQSEESATVEYNGACRGFLSQNLMPRELCGETTQAEVTDGSALKQHGVEKFEHISATELAEAYGLMQKVAKDPDKFKVCLAAVQARKAIDKHLELTGLVERSTFVRTGPNTRGHSCILTSDGDPAVYVTCCPGGEQVTVEMQLHSSGSNSTAESIVARATQWIDRIASVCEKANPEPVTANG
ncbi:MAG: hypothetical protein Q7S86_05265 [bacterium]|nr:hypothetical protein [bacterium]